MGEPRREAKTAGEIHRRIAELVKRERGDANQVSVRHEDPAKLRADAERARARGLPAAGDGTVSPPVASEKKKKPGVRTGSVRNREWAKVCANPDCPRDGAEFRALSANALYCSDECRDVARDLARRDREIADADPGNDSPDIRPGDTVRQVRSALAAGCLTGPAIVDATGLTPKQVTPVLRRMCHAGILIEDGHVPSTKGGRTVRRYRHPDAPASDSAASTEEAKPEVAPQSDPPMPTPIPTPVEEKVEETGGIVPSQVSVMPPEMPPVVMRAPGDAFPFGCELEVAMLPGSPNDSPDVVEIVDVDVTDVVRPTSSVLHDRYVELLFMLAERDGADHVLRRLERIVAAEAA